MNEELQTNGEVSVENPRRTFSAWIVCCALFLLSVVFVPSFLIPFQVVKLSIFVGALILATCGICFSKYKEGYIKLPTFLTFLAICTPIAYVFSNFMNKGYGGIFGTGFEVHSALIVLLMFVLLFVTTSSFQNRKNLLYAYLTFFSAFIFVALFHFARLMLGNVMGLSLGLGGDLTTNTIGKWNDLAVFLGLGTILTLITVQFLSVPKLLKGLLYTVASIALFMIALNGFILVWVMMGLVALSIVVYVYFQNKKEEQNQAKATSYFAMTILALALVFTLSGGYVSNYLDIVFNVSFVEARPSLSPTLHIISESLKVDPLFGSGQNGFMSQWSLSKPDLINETPLWNADFMYGVGFIPTLLVTSGLVGSLPWILFLCVLMYFGSRLLTIQFVTPFNRYIAISSFVATLYLWVLMIMYVPSIVTMALTFFFTGIIIAFMYEQKVLVQKSIAISSTPGKFATRLAILFVCILVIGLGYVSSKRIISVVYFQKSIIEVGQNENIDKSIEYMIKAITNHPENIYFRALTQLHSAKLQQLLAKSKDINESQTEIQALLNQTIMDAKYAIAVDPNNYQNYLLLADLFASLVPIPDAYENAVATYKEVIKLAPKNPGVRLSLARLELINKNSVAARAYIAEALSLKKNYTEAIFLLTQIEINEGNLDKAIVNVEKITAINPNPEVFFQLGFLKYNAKDYRGATLALESAVVAVPTYSNAKYFLGLSYSKQGLVDKAIAQFEDVKTLNPDNKEVQFILDNLKSGKAPFAEVRPPLDDAPEKRDKPPIDESKKTQE